MGDQGSRRSYLITMDPEGRWHSSSIPDCASSCISGRDRLSKNRKNGHKIERIDRRTWIWSGGWDSSEIFSSGFTYVALQGKDTMCVVTGDKKMDKRKYRRRMGALITEIKANGLYGYNKREFGKYLGMLPEDEDLRPFAAVSVVLGTKEVNAESGDGAEEITNAVLKQNFTPYNHHRIRARISSANRIFQASSVGLNEKEVIDILMRKVEKGSGFSYEETIQTALSALQRLLKMELMACRVKVCVQKKGTRADEQLSAKEIEEHLEVIKNQQLDAHHC